MGGAGSASEPPKRRYRTSSLASVPFDQDRCRHEIARMIIMHDYPLHMVEHPGFVAFVQNLQPRFDMVSFNTVQGDCVATYLREKQSLLKFIEGIPGRICLTLDLWTSRQSVGYVFLTGHFIDMDWKLHRRILNVVMEPFTDSETAFSHAVAVCLSDWSLENKLFSITINQPLNEIGIEYLRAQLSIKNPLLLNGQFLVGNCIARTLSSMALDVLGAGRETIKKIRDSVKYVKTSESHEEKFLELKQQLQVPSTKSLFLDDQNQWNTTYEMLVAASELKEVFSCLDTSDPDYKEAPSMDDWKQTWKIQTELARAATCEDPFISNLAKPMQEKVDKYWKDCGLVLAIAVAMDPRFKMKLVEFSFPKIYGDEAAPTCIRVVDEGLHELFLEYVALPLPLTPTYVDEGNAGSMKGRITHKEAFSQATDSQILMWWWKLNKLKYPTLSKMARDILSIPVSSVAVESIYDTVGKEMDEYRNSLRPETVEALICAKDWLQYGSSPPEISNALVKMEF
ncbi:Zinc finger BED domain-containing protein DAYSLEEPER [Vitis vinifera]|uniref:Zinc finger BED domain-containing protein DAYSLEEPER n=1 Tax=Vitis vinifera TaxID=29760 RepID=A0A438GPG1_VITVI|nr:Zinc finger BED domain-containing protein DAYSLEEPER [Vitis vinifera]